VLPRPPPRNSLLNEAIQPLQRLTPDAAEVLLAPRMYGFDARDDSIECQPRISSLPAQFVVDAPLRLLRDVEVQPSVLPSVLVPKEVEAFTSRIQNTRFWPR